MSQSPINKPNLFIPDASQITQLLFIVARFKKEYLNLFHNRSSHTAVLPIILGAYEGIVLAVINESSLYDCFVIIVLNR